MKGIKPFINLLIVSSSLKEIKFSSCFIFIENNLDSWIQSMPTASARLSPAWIASITYPFLDLKPWAVKLAAKALFERLLSVFIARLDVLRRLKCFIDYLEVLSRSKSKFNIYGKFSFGYITVFPLSIYWIFELCKYLNTKKRKNVEFMHPMKRRFT